ncbi:hypothetical protein HYX07_04820 [Candidatus Woesearchaeota archaeon]|nr:hypothetical protein [Candidatus Woesearchaeota archaeon]
MKKEMSNKKGERFEFGLLIVVLTISISLLSFVTEENNLTGLVVEESQKTQISPILLEFNDVKSISTLSAGNYFIDGDGIVYWTDDDLKPAIAKIHFLEESQKNRQIYIDAEGNVGYILEAIKENE